MTNANLPKSVRVGPVKYSVDIVDNLRHDHSLYGQCTYGDTRIKVAADTPADRQVQTFIHELIHAMINEAGEHEVNANEAFVERFANVMTQVAKDNGWLTKGMLRK